MTTHARKVEWAAALAAVSLLPACDGAAAQREEAAREVLTQTTQDDCLFLVWGAQEQRDEQFDKEHDTVDGGAISCATGTSPSQYRDAILAIRDAATANDSARILEEVGIPLLYIDSEGERRELNDPDAIAAVFDEIFDDKMLALMRELDLNRMTVEREAGGFFGLGALWLVPEGAGGRPRIVTINRQALAEAIGEQAQPDISPENGPVTHDDPTGAR